jgi:hypothetical protein
MERFKPGQRGIPAASLNRFAAAAEAFEQTRAGNALPPPGATLPAGVVKIKNDSGYAVARFGVLGIDGIQITPTDNLAEFQRAPLLTGDSPAVPDHNGQFVVALEPIADGKIGRARVSGLTACKVDLDDADHAFADVKAANITKLQSTHRGGARIRYKEASTGSDKWCLVDLGVPPIVPAEYWADLDGPSSPSGGSYQLVTIANPDATQADETKLWTLASSILTCARAGLWRIDAQHSLLVNATQGTVYVPSVPSTPNLTECTAGAALVAYIDTGGGFAVLGNAGHVESNAPNAAPLTARYVYPAVRFDVGDKLKMMAGQGHESATGWSGTDGYLMLTRISD